MQLIEIGQSASRRTSVKWTFVHRARRRPMGRFVRRRCCVRADNLCHALGWHRRLAGRIGLVAQQAFHAFAHEAFQSRSHAGSRQQKLGNEKENLACRQISIVYVEIVHRERSVIVPGHPCLNRPAAFEGVQLAPRQQRLKRAMLRRPRQGSCSPPRRMNDAQIFHIFSLEAGPPAGGVQVQARDDGASTLLT